VPPGPDDSAPAARTPPEISFCIVATAKRELLLRCLDAVAPAVRDLGVASEVLVLDNASGDGSAEAARAHPAGAEVIARRARRSKPENANELMQRARGGYCLLLDEDAELRPGAARALYDALRAAPRAGAAGAALLAPDGEGQPSAWRFPSVPVALAGALFLHRWLTVQSGGSAPREVDWVQSAAVLVRRSAAEQIDWQDPAFFVYSDEVDFCRRLRDAGWRILHVPGARAVHHEQLSSERIPMARIVEFARNRDRYMRKHHSPAAARTVRWLTAWAYALRALAALVLPGHRAGRYWAHVRATLRPERGEGIREAAERHNRALAGAGPDP
jgi:GT2 family glycosyltransferase